MCCHHHNGPGRVDINVLFTYLTLWLYNFWVYLFFFFLSHLSGEDATKIISLTAGWSLCSLGWWRQLRTGGPGQVVWLGGARHAGLWLMLLPGMSVPGNCGKNNIRILQSLEMETGVTQDDTLGVQMSLPEILFRWFRTKTILISWAVIVLGY